MFTSTPHSARMFSESLFPAPMATNAVKYSAKNHDAISSCTAPIVVVAEAANASLPHRVQWPSAGAGGAAIFRISGTSSVAATKASMTARNASA